MLSWSGIEKFLGLVVQDVDPLGIENKRTIIMQCKFINRKMKGTCKIWLRNKEDDGRGRIPLPIEVIGRELPLPRESESKPM